MEMITKYVANDGKEFEDEDECLAYERKITVIKGFIGYDRDGKVVDPKDYADLDDWTDEIHYLRVTDITGWNKFEELCNDEDVFFYDGLGDISENGLYFFDDDHDYWISWEYEYEKLRNIRKKMDY